MRSPILQRTNAAVQRLDAMVYSANGHGSVAFPAVAAAIARGDSAGVQRAVGDAAGGRCCYGVDLELSPRVLRLR